MRCTLLAQPSGGLNHLEIAYSKSHAYLWRDGSGSVGYGRGNAGDPGRYIHILAGMSIAMTGKEGPDSLSVRTFLARKRDILSPETYSIEPTTSQRRLGGRRPKIPSLLLRDRNGSL